jgi:hypothetical protein
MVKKLLHWNLDDEHFSKSNFRRYAVLLAKNTSYIFKMYVAAQFFARALPSLET